MAAVTQTANAYGVMGNKNVVTATFTSPADTNTWDTGLRTIEYVGLTVISTNLDPAADQLTVASISGGTVTLDQDGTTASALAIAIGY